MDLSTNMKAIGKRIPYLAKYKVGSSKDGDIQGIEVEIFANCGITPNENRIGVIRDFIDNGICNISRVIVSIIGRTSRVVPYDLPECALTKYKS